MARGLLDVLREFSDNENDFISVMETVARMSEDGGRFVFLYLTSVICCEVFLHLLVYFFCLHLLFLSLFSLSLVPQLNYCAKLHEVFRHFDSISMCLFRAHSAS